MSNEPQTPTTQAPGRGEPIFNLPASVAMLCGAFVAVYLVQTFLLNPLQRTESMLWFGFIPVRFLDPAAEFGGFLANLWTPFTHAFLHGGVEHLIFNTIWLAVFGTPVARRYGGRVMVVLFLVTALAGAMAFAVDALFFSQSAAVLIGASGGVAGLTGAAVRFMFQPVIFAADPETGLPVPVGRRLASLRQFLADRRARSFALVWVALNAVVPLLPLGEMQIAWQAHLGGFFAGLLLVPLFERKSA